MNNEKKKVFQKNTYISGYDNGIFRYCVLGGKLLSEYPNDKWKL